MALAFYLLIGFWNQTLDVAVPVLEFLKLFIADDELLCVSEGSLPNVLSLDQQTLKYLCYKTCTSKHDVTRIWLQDISL